MTETKSPPSTRRGGLSDAEVLASREKHGANVFSTRKQKSFVRRFFENLGDPVIRILLAALIVNLIFVFKGGDIAETVGIGISVFLAAFISALSEHGGENAFRRLAGEEGAREYRVRRNGKILTVPSSELVVGDTVLLCAGEKIPADCRLMRGEVSVDQSAITGESKEVNKHPEAKTAFSPSPESKCTLLGGCPILAGEGEAAIFAVGDNSFLGKISIEVQADTRESPLKIRLAKLAHQISLLGYLAAFLVAFAFLFNCFVIDSGFEWGAVLLKIRNVPYLLEKLLHAFMLGLTVIVVAVPEGLPMMIAVVLSSNIRRMVRDNVLVRKPVGIEAAGSMNLLFTDKTGTLTEGKMSLDKIILPDGTRFGSADALLKRSPDIGRLFVMSCTQNTSSELSGNIAVGGNGTDRALLTSAIGLPLAEGCRVTRKLPFDSTLKYSACSLDTKSGHRILIKGAPEKLLRFAEYALLPNGNICPISQVRRVLEQSIAELCADGKRVLLLALSDSFPTGNALPPLTVICAVSLCDPLRREAHKSVSELRGAGIGVVMITGDSRATASAIARGCGIIGGERQLVLEGSELAALSDGEVAKILPRLAVICRALPTDKSRLVRISQSLELVVGMTGDGINDAPALRCADIGFAMGSGTDVAKDASDIIILDNNLASIVRAVLYGRNIFKSIRKFITLQLTMNLCAVGVSMIGPFIGVDAPVTVVQMLWINIIMDTLGGLAFAGEYPSPLCMKEPPKRRDEPILNRYMVNQILTLGIFTIGMCIFFLLSPDVSAHFRYSPDKIYLLTAFFAMFIFTSVFNCFNCRGDRLRFFSGLSHNPAFITIMLLIMTVQIIFVYLGGTMLRTLPLIPTELLYAFCLSLTVFPIELLRRLIWRLRGKRQGF